MHTLLGILSAAILAVGSFFHVVPSQSLGSALPSATAVFETSLAAPITSSATTMTLTANSVRGGGSLSGYNCFTVDEGSAQAETICGTVSGTTVSTLSRGISQSTGTTTVSALQFAHRRGANVKISDFPLIQILKAQANGEDTYPNLLNYTYSPDYSSASTTAIASKGYVDGVAVAGASNADDSTKGIVETATAAEAAAGTNTGSTGARLVLGANLATSTCQAAANSVLVASSTTGKLDGRCLDTSNNTTWSGTQTFSGGMLATASSSLTATTSIAASDVNGNALKLNGVAHSFPSTQAASSTTWAFDANGKASYQLIATSTVGTLSVAANSGANVITTGFQPRVIRMWATYASGGNSTILPLGSSGVYVVSTGKYATSYNLNAQGASSAASATAGVRTDAIVYGERDSTATAFSGTISAVSSTGFTLTMTNGVSANPTVQIAWEAEP